MKNKDAYQDGMEKEKVIKITHKLQPFLLISFSDFCLLNNSTGEDNSFGWIEVADDPTRIKRMHIQTLALQAYENLPFYGP